MLRAFGRGAISAAGDGEEEGHGPPVSFDIFSTMHHAPCTWPQRCRQVPFKQWLRKELDVRREVPVVVDKSHRLELGDMRL
ncbi:hypothetical protein HYH03_016609 [Edaphochlamys debaryana]|uniref:Uncharacterized protein n=1 Tax=Edaphochlamys debaryana TaxID=47281 RepID=A0A835XI82_9CHLO|nr:hypothetical protein HYH03_016609 [Edaphochlamys debaryana]|eukprot:KAG2484563.1 hypothetical protein HYH03_016609 [Edaphochlamys debaryana]